MGRGGEPSVPLCLPSGAASPTALHLGWDPQRGAVGLWERGWRRVRGWLGAAVWGRAEGGAVQSGEGTAAGRPHFGLLVLELSL